MAAMKRIAMLAQELGLPAGELAQVEKGLAKYMLEKKKIAPAAHELAKVLGFEYANRETYVDFMHLTREEAVGLRRGAILHSLVHTNRDGTPLRVRVNGKCQTWVTRPTEFRLPVKYGLRTCLNITQKSSHDWYVA